MDPKPSKNPGGQRGYRTFDRVIEEADREVINLEGDQPPPAKKRKRTVTVIDFTQDEDEVDVFAAPPRRRERLFASRPVRHVSQDEEGVDVFAAPPRRRDGPFAGLFMRSVTQDEEGVDVFAAPPRRGETTFAGSSPRYVPQDNEGDDVFARPLTRRISAGSSIRHVKASTCMSCEETKPSDAFPTHQQDNIADLGGSICRRCWEANSYAEKANAARKEKECSICYDSAPAHVFPDAPHIGADAGSHTVCIGCWERHLHSEIERRPWDQLTCPQDGCGEVMEYGEIMTLDKRFEQAIEPILIAKATASCLAQDETYFACPSATCKSGVLVEPGRRRGTFSCEACGHQFCFDCDVPMHTGLSCADYQDSIHGNSRRAREERESEAEVARKYKTCPNKSCGSKLDLMSGCDHVICLRCKQKFNWSSVPIGVPNVRNDDANWNEPEDAAARHQLIENLMQVPVNEAVAEQGGQAVPAQDRAAWHPAVIMPPRRGRPFRHPASDGQTLTRQGWNGRR